MIVHCTKSSEWHVINSIVQHDQIGLHENQIEMWIDQIEMWIDQIEMWIDQINVWFVSIQFENPV